MKSAANLDSPAASVGSAGAQPPQAFPWSPDQGDGTYRNPILCADYSDPDVIRVGQDFFLTASSFNCTPGLPILHSRDLVNWTLINHAVPNLPHPRYREVQRGCGVWAPALRFHAGKFWIFFPMPDEGIYFTTAEDPAGKWSEPHLVQAGRGLIDPCPLWDEDGKAYLVHAYAGSRAGIKHRLRVCPMVPDGSRLSGKGEIVFHDPECHPTIEGPKFLRKDGWYYILAPAGGVRTGWQTALRSRNIFGPYEDRIVLEQGASPVNGPHQGALVDLPNGEWWFVHFQDTGVYGRIVHLQPVAWEDGWPVIGRDRNAAGVGEPVLHFQKPGVNPGSTIVNPQTSDEFNAASLGLQWQWQSNHEDGWCSAAARPGWLRLVSQHVPEANLARAGNLLLQKFPARSFGVETEFEFSPAQPGEEAGLVVMGHEFAALTVRQAPRGHRIFLRSSGRDELLSVSGQGRYRFRVNISEGGLCTFSFIDAEGQVQHVAQPFRAQAGMWVGAKVGIYSVRPGREAGGHADFDWFRFSRGEVSANPDPGISAEDKLPRGP